MGLRERIARRAVQGTHVLVVEVPGWGETRMRVEDELARRGWTVATSPADADALLVCGSPGQQLDAVCSRLWAQLPGPRARATVLVADDVTAALARLAGELLDDATQRVDARARSRRPAAVGGDQETTHQAAPGGGGATDDAMAAGMDMDMPMPGGIPLASGGPDRDGLEMDVLHVALGPVLPHWPAGLVVRCALKGDVIVQAEVELLPAAPGTNGDGPAKAGSRRSAEDEHRRTVIRYCDAAVQLLALVGWWSAACRARRIRDEVASGTALAEVAPRLERLAKDVKRSRLLGWGLKGIAANTGPGAQRAGDGDAATARTRLLHWLNEAGRIARDTADSYEPLDFADRQRESLGAIPSLVNGTDVASARLIIASLAIDTSVLATSGEARS